MFVYLMYQNTTITDQNLLLFYSMKLHSFFKVSNNFEMELWFPPRCTDKTQDNHQKGQHGRARQGFHGNPGIRTERATTPRRRTQRPVSLRQEVGTQVNSSCLHWLCASHSKCCEEWNTFAFHDGHSETFYLTRGKHSIHLPKVLWHRAHESLSSEGKEMIMKKIPDDSKLIKNVLYFGGELREFISMTYLFP